MKKFSFTAGVLFIVLSSFQAAAFAGYFQGTVKSVDRIFEKMVLKVGSGTETVEYTNVTQWPNGVKDPTALIGKEVNVRTDSLNGKALAVDEVKQPPTTS